MEFGKVKFFDSREGKRFGFIIDGDGSEIFFHFNDGRFIEAGKKEPQFTEPTFVYKGKIAHLRDPQPGDLVVFERIRGSKGFKASPWGYKDNYDHALDVIAKRPPPPVYRVFESMNSLGDPQGEPNKLWEGSDIDQLMRKYPVPSGSRSIGSDPLLPYYSDSDNIFETRHWFEKQLPDGNWERCPDPRPLSGAGRQFERINNRW